MSKGSCQLGDITVETCTGLLLIQGGFQMSPSLPAFFVCFLEDCHFDWSEVGCQNNFDFDFLNG